MISERQLQENQSITVEVGKTVVKKALLNYFKLSLLIIAGVFFLIMMLGALIFTFTLSKEEEATTSSAWEVGTISEFGANEIPAEYIPIYKEAAEKYGVPWNLLAAHHRVETRFSTLSSMISPVGAIGHMQFMPLTWVGWNYPGGSRLGNANIPDSILTSPEAIKKYGGYGTDGNDDGRADPMDLEDAVHSAARYLAANGATDGDLRKAVYAYNHSPKYVNDVLGYADLYVKDFKAVPVGGGTSEVMNGAAWPVPNYMGVSSPFGPRPDPVYGGIDFHYGIDIAGGGINGKPVVALSDGVVTTAAVVGSYGNAIFIDHGNGTSTRYAHLSNIDVKVGQKVKAGQMIAKVGSTGKSTGPHLHFEIKVQGQSVDPLKYLSSFQYARI
jgi:peptidoglycan LD-endopeptidase LytH